MKNLSLFLAAMALAGAVAAQTAPGAAAAQAAPAGGGFTGNTETARGGFTGPVSLVTAAQAKTLRDDTKVTLRGTIETHLGGDNYLFKDASGTVTVEIKAKRWQGQAVSPQEQVQIDGEVDVEHGGVEIEVKRLRKL